MKKIFIFTFLLAFFIFQAAPTLAVSSVNTKFNEGLEKTGRSDAAGYPVETIKNNPGNFIARMFGSVLAPTIVGVIAMVIFIYGGYTLMMARGNEEQVEKAKTILMNTALALIVIFSAYAIVNLIIPLWTFVTK